VSEPGIKEVRQPDFPGLMITEDPLGGARITQNCDLWRLGELDSRGGLRRLNHRRYTGGVQAILDVQRICDYGKVLVCQGNGDVFEHEEAIGPSWGGPVGPGDAGGSGAVPFVAKGYPPVALASANPTFGLAPLAVQFSSAGSFDPDGGAITYFWDFGDGADSSQANPLHTYAGSQIYNAQLTVTDSEGQSASATVEVDTRDVIVVADFNAQILVSEDAGLNFAAAVGVPAAGTHAVLGANGYIFAFVQNGANIDVYRSEDGVNFVLLSNFAGAPDPYRAHPILGHNQRLLVPVANGAGSSMAYSDDDGQTWNVVLIGAGMNAAPSTARLSGANRLMCCRQNVGGIGNPIDIFTSADNGQTWVPSLGSFGDSVNHAIIGGGQANRAICVARTAAACEIRTSDDNAATWQLRDTIAAANPPALAYTDGAEALAMQAGAANLRHSLNNGTAWNAAVFPSAWAHHTIGRPDGYFCAGFGGLYFTAALPNFALRGAAGIWLYTVATLRNQET